MRKPVKRLVLAAIVVTLLFSLGTICFRTYIARQLLLIFFDRAGLTISELRVLALRSSKIVLDSGRVCYGASGCIRFQGIEAEFTWAGLRAGKLQKVLFHELLVEIPQSEEPARFSPEEWGQLIPDFSLFFDFPIRELKTKGIAELSDSISREGITVFPVECSFLSQQEVFFARAQVSVAGSGTVHEASMEFLRKGQLTFNYRKGDFLQLSVVARRKAGVEKRGVISSIDAAVTETQMGALKISGAELSYAAALAGEEHDLKIRIPSISGDVYGESLPELEFAAALSIGSDGLDGDLSLRALGSDFRLEGQVSQQYGGRGEMLIATGAREFSAEKPFQLSSLPFVTDVPLFVSGGTFRGDAVWHWGADQMFSAKYGFQISDVRGRYRKIPFEDLNSQGTITQTSEGFVLQPVKVRVGRVVPGVVLEDLRFQSGFEWKGNRKHIQFLNATASVFGGEVHADDVDFYPGVLSVALPLRLEGISLEKLLEIYQLKDLSASGILDGRVPLNLNLQGVSMKGGKLSARPPGGFLKVGERVSAALGNAPGLDVAARALSDYRYETLELTGDYLPTGILYLKIGLTGSSPALNTTRPVNVNLSIEENVLNLWRSLQITELIEQEITRGNFGLQKRGKSSK